jgi:D-alanine-D-alanine ligase
VIVKPAREDGSIGIHFGAVCASIKELMDRIDYIHAQFDSPALIEEYIEGRELYVGVIGNQEPEALPVIELDLSQLPEGVPKIAGAEVKWEEGTDAYEKTKPFFPKDLPEETVTRLQQSAVQAYQALQLRDYGRIDFRLAQDGTVHVLEVNPNPYLLPTAEFAMAAGESGRDYDDVVGEIVTQAMAATASRSARTATAEGTAARPRTLMQLTTRRFLVPVAVVLALVARTYGARLRRRCPTASASR